MKSHFLPGLMALMLLAGCSPAADAPLGAVLTAEVPSDGFTAGGSIDLIRYNEAGDQVTIEGWHMLTPKTKPKTLAVLAEGAVSVVSVSSRERPDVVEAVGNRDLLNSGFVLVLDLETPAPLSRLCILVEDRHYGRRLLNPHSADMPSCFTR